MFPALGYLAWHHFQTRDDSALRTSRLEILNSDGLPVVILGATVEGGVISTQYNTGATSAMLGVDARARDASLTLYDGKGIRTNVLGTHGNGARGLITFAHDGQIASTLGVDAHDRSSLRLTHDNHDRIRVLASPTGGELWAWNDRGARVFQLGTSPIGNGQVVASNERGTPIFRIGASMRGAGFLQTFSDEGVELVRLGSTTAGLGLVLTSHTDGTPAVQLTSTSLGEGAVSIHPLDEQHATLTLVAPGLSDELD
jgi:hypothetical protein